MAKIDEIKRVIKLSVRLFALVAISYGLYSLTTTKIKVSNIGLKTVLLLF